MGHLCHLLPVSHQLSSVISCSNEKRFVFPLATEVIQAVPNVYFVCLLSVPSSGLFTEVHAHARLKGKGGKMAVNLNTERGGSFKICLLKFMCINVDSYTVSLFYRTFLHLTVRVFETFRGLREKEPSVF